MSFFEKLKKDIGIAEEEKEKVKPPKKEKVKKKELGKEEKPKKIPVSAPKKASDWLKTEGQLAVDIYQTDSEFCIQAPIAGVESEDIDISIENEMLVIKGERKEPEKDKEKNYFYQECYWGIFSRQIILPEDVDTSRIKASLGKGILTIKIPRVRRVKKKKITIQTAE
ncbi:Hsp20/alpha crystallin family protein [Patescibacteria group bacterium]|nr:Hsp20/alpha crystallin family protein [Patescibacteria group bacterium]